MTKSMKNYPGGKDFSYCLLVFWFSLELEECEDATLMDADSNTFMTHIAGQPPSSYSWGALDGSYGAAKSVDGANKMTFYAGIVNTVGTPTIDRVSFKVENAVRATLRVYNDEDLIIEQVSVVVLFCLTIYKLNHWA